MAQEAAVDVPLMQNEDPDDDQAVLDARAAADLDNEGLAIPKKRWDWDSEQKDIDYVTSVIQAAPHLKPHSKVGGAWGEAKKKFDERYTNFKTPALTTFKNRFESLKKMLDGHDKTTYMSGSDQDLKPHFEALRDYITQKEEYQAKSDKEKQLEYEREQRAKAALDSGLKKLASKLDVTIKPEPGRAPETPQELADDASVSESGRGVKRGRSSSSSSGTANGSFTDPLLQSAFESEARALESKKAMFDADMEWRRSQANFQIQFEESRLQFERQRSERELSLRSEELQVRRQEVDNERRRLDLQEKMGSQQSDLMSLLLQKLTNEKK